MMVLLLVLQEQKVQFLTSVYFDELPSLLKKHSFDLDILYTELSEERIKLLHKNGIEINCWTCDDKEWGEKLSKWEIDYITSNILE